MANMFRIISPRHYAVAGAALLLPLLPLTLAAQDPTKPGAAAVDAAPAVPADGPTLPLQPAALTHMDARPADPSRPEAVAAVQVASELAIDRWLRPGEFAWNDEGVPDGETVIVVNIRARVLSVYRGGIEIGRSSLIYGANEQPTPHGTFTILEKDEDHVSNIYVGAPMPHMLRLTWDGVAIHGSQHIRDDWATRGCVGLPLEFADLLFDVADVGDRVVIWSGEAVA